MRGFIWNFRIHAYARSHTIATPISYVTKNWKTSQSWCRLWSLAESDAAAQLPPEREPAAGDVADRRAAARGIGGAGRIRGDGGCGANERDKPGGYVNPPFEVHVRYKYMYLVKNTPLGRTKQNTK